MELEPLTREVIDEAFVAGVLQQAIDFFPQAVAFERSTFGGIEEGVIRHRTPEEVGETRGKFAIGEALAGLRFAFDEVDEVARGQYALEGDAIGLGSFFASAAFGRVGFEEFG